MKNKKVEESTSPTRPVSEDKEEREVWIHNLSGGQSTVWLHNGHLHSASGILDEHDRHMANEECKQRYPTPPVERVSEDKEKQIRENFAIQLTVDTTSWAMKHNQVVGENREYFITLRQLESFLNMQLEQPIKSSDIYEQHK